MRECFCIRKIIDANNLDEIGSGSGYSEHEATDAAKTIDCDANCHGIEKPKNEQNGKHAKLQIRSALENYGEKYSVSICFA